MLLLNTAKNTSLLIAFVAAQHNTVALTRRVGEWALAPDSARVGLTMTYELNAPLTVTIAVKRLKETQI